MMTGLVFGYFSGAFLRVEKYIYNITAPETRDGWMGFRGFLGEEEMGFILEMGL
jgi:hypothetical protein